MSSDAQGIDEGFDGPGIHPRLSWWNSPPKAVTAQSRLLVETAAETDFWQRTHYGFRNDNGHFLSAEQAGDFVLGTTVHFHPLHQYDQAGLMVRLSPECWLKTSVEFEPDGPNRLGVVVTNGGWSDWSTQDVDKEFHALALRVRRESGDYIVEYSRELDVPRWSQLRVAHLFEDTGATPLRCGLYACSPKKAGFTAEFEHLRIEPGRARGA